MKKKQIIQLLLVFSIVTGGVGLEQVTAFASTLPKTNYGVVDNLNGGYLNFRTGPGLSYKIIGTLESGNRVTIISEENGWDEVNYDGTEGYVYGEYINNSSTISSENGTVTGLSNGYKLNFRSGPSTNDSIIGELSEGTTFTIISEENGWYRIDYNGTEGYVYGAYVSVNKSSTESSGTNSSSGTKSTGSSTSGSQSSSAKSSSSSSTGSTYSETGTVINLSNGYKLNFRSGPSTNDSIIGELSEGTTFTIISEENGWYKIDYNGTEGYVYGAYVSVNKSSTQTSGTNSSNGSKSTSSSNSGSQSSSAKSSSSSSSSSTYSETGTVINLSNGYKLNFRSGPSTNDSIIGELSEGTTFTIILEENGWYKIDYNGTEGYVYGAYVSVNKSSTQSSGTNNSNGSKSTGSSGSGSQSGSTKSSSSSSSDSTSSETGTVINLSNGYKLNFRSGPSTNDSIIGELSEGTTFTIISEENGWYKIDYNGTEGYVYGAYVSVNKSSTESSSTNSSNGTKSTSSSNSGSQSSSTKSSSSSSTGSTYSETGTVINLSNGYKLNFRSGPSTSDSIVGELSEGTTFTIISEENGWYKIDYNGTEGYVYGAYVSVNKSSTESSGTNSSNGSKSTGSSSSSSQSSSTKSSSSSSTESTSSETGTVTNLSNGYKLNFRSGPSTSDSIVGELSEGTTFTIISEENGWYKIDYNGTEGYVYGAYVSISSSSVSSQEGENQDTSSLVGVVVNLNSSIELNFRQGPSINDTIIGEIPVGTAFRVLSENNGWYEINYNGIIGYVYGYYVSLLSNSSSNTGVSSELVDFVASWEGFSSTPYLDATGHWTVGFGDNYGSVYPGDVTYSEALGNLINTLSGLKQQVASLTVGLNLNENQINALTDFAYNLGLGSLENSDLLENIQCGIINPSIIMGDFQAWSYAGQNFMQGLYDRRTAEANMFLYGEYELN